MKRRLPALPIGPTIAIGIGTCPILSYDSISRDFPLDCENFIRNVRTFREYIRNRQFLGHLLQDAPPTLLLKREIYMSHSRTRGDR